MAFVEKYRCEWYDRLKLKWRYDILEDGFSGSITDLVASADPLTIDFLSGSDDIFESPIRGTKCDLRVKVSTSFALADLYTVQDRKFKVNIYYNTTSLFCTGYIVSNNYQEAYNDTPYDVVISANDGLGYLKEIDFADIASSFDRREVISFILYTIFSQIGITEFKEIINIYEDSMDNTVDDSPLDQEKIDIDLFDDMTCYEALEHILKKYDAICRQWAGEYYLFRPVEMTDSTAYGRKFISGVTHTSFTVTPALNINRSGSASDIRDINGGRKNIFPPVKKLIINQNYGWKQSWLDYWEFEGKDFASNDWSGWTRVGLTVHTPIGQTLPSEKKGVLMGYTAASTAPDVFQNLYKDFAFHALLTSDVLVFEFDYLLYNSSASTVNDVDIYVKVTNGAGTKWLEIDTANLYKWSDTEAFITIRLNSPAGPTEWVTFSRRIPGLPTNGKYRVTLYGADESSSVRVGLRNLKFYCTSDAITSMRTFTMPVGPPVKFDMARFGKYMPRTLLTFEKYATIIQRQYVITNAINGTVRTYDMILGDVTDAAIDNVIEQFAGAIGVSLATLTAVAAGFVTDFASDYLSGGVVVTSDGADIIFEAQVAGVNFTGATSITNKTGDLDGSVVATTANTPAIWTIELTGTSGEINIVVNGISKPCTIVTTLAAAAATFASVNSGSFPGVAVTNPSGAILTFTGGVSSFTIQEVDPDMNATGGKVQDPVKRKDTITLTGSYGTADILCDGTTKEASFKLIPASAWNTRGGSENAPILELIGGELGNQFSRPKELLLSLPIWESDTVDNTPHLSLIANYQDSLNTVGGVNRKFVINQGSFDVKNRKWNIDLTEIIP